jgi:parallel beta-helix repeat protein
MLSLTFNIQPAKGEPRTWIVDDDGPADFRTIQEAINAASAGDTISTRAGVYYGEVLVNKSISLVGEDRETTIINGNGTLGNAGLSIVAQNVSVANVAVTNAPTGILIGANNSVICNVKVFGTYMGIWVAQSASHGIISKSLVVNQTVHHGEGEDFGGAGIALDSCLFYNIIENVVDNNGLIGIWIRAGFILVENNTISNNSRYGLEFDWAVNCSVAKNHIVSNFRGVGVSEASNCCVYANNIADNTHCAIEMGTASSNILIYHNNFVNNSNQAESYQSANTWDNGYQGNYWSDYTGIDADSDGIGDTPYVVDADNQDRYPLMYPWSPLPVHNINTGLGYAAIQEAINAPETLDGHTIFVEAGTYYENVVVNKPVSLFGEDKDTTIIDGGQSGDTVTISNGVKFSGFTVQNCGTAYYWLSGIMLSGSSNSTIFGNKVVNNLNGISLLSSSNNIVLDNNVTATGDGIYIIDSPNNTIASNNVAENGDGIILHGSSGNIISGNNVTNNLFYGILLTWSSNYNVLTDNTVACTDYDGLRLFKSSNNMIFQNSFVNNSPQVSTGDSLDNVWDDGYSSGGNYWSDYNATDLYSGPNQNETGSDGIGDTPYVIDAYNRDNYPLMHQSQYVPLAGDLNLDGTVDISDAILAALAFGSYPGHPRWNGQADLNQDNVIDIFDIIILVNNFGKH